MPLRERLKSQIAFRVRAWIDGDDALYDGDPRRRITSDETSWAPVRLLQYGPQDGFPVTIGKYCAIHHRAVIFHGGNHRLDWIGVKNSRWEDGDWVHAPGGAPISRGPVVIGNDVYIGYEALVMSGITVGDGAVLAARACVTKDVRPYEIVGGNPARHIGWRFDEPTREALLRIRWWDWPDETVKAHLDEINSADTESFIARWDPAR